MVIQSQVMYSCVFRHFLQSLKKECKYKSTKTTYMVDTWSVCLSLSLPVHNIEPVTKLLHYRSSLPKGVERKFHKTHLTDSNTSLNGLNEFLSVLLTFVCFG